MTINKFKNTFGLAEVVLNEAKCLVHEHLQLNQLN